MPDPNSSISAVNVKFSGLISGFRINLVSLIRGATASIIETLNKRVEVISKLLFVIAVAITIISA